MLFLGGLAAAGYAAYEIVEQPASTFFGRTFTGIPPGRHMIAVTFDDGPNDPYTSQILDLLRREGARATFFVVGRAAARDPKVLRRMVREGHAIGNHTWDHPHLNLLSRTGIDDELARTEAAIAAATGTRPAIARPPYGARSFAVLDEMRRQGYTCVMWSVPLAEEWTGAEAHAVARRILDRAADGSIVVLHDGDRGRPADRENVVEATREVVEGLRARGLRLVTIPQMLAAGGGP